MRKAHIFAFTQIKGGSNFVEAVVSGLVCIAASKTTFPAVGKKKRGPVPLETGGVGPRRSPSAQAAVIFHKTSSYK